MPVLAKAVLGICGGLFSALSLMLIIVGTLLWAPVHADGALTVLTIGAPATPTRFLDRTGQRLLLELQPAGSPPASWISFEQNPSSPALIAAAEALLAVDGRAHLPSGAGVSAAWEALLQTWGGQPNLAGEVANLLTERRPGSISGGFSRERVVLLAADLAWRYPAQVLLEYVLNATYYGRWATGLDEAALAYFGMPAQQLSPDQAVTLVAVGQDPSLAEQPLELQKARARLLQRMASLGWMGSLQAAQEALRPIAFVPPAETANPAVIAYLHLVEEQLEPEFREATLATSGFEITTSLDFSLQLEALCAAQSEAAWLAGASSALRTPGADGSACGAADLIEGLGPVRAPGIDFGVAVFQATTGELLAYFPSVRDESLTDRSGQAGTALLPFVYLAAFAQGYSPASSVWDVPSPTPSGWQGELPLSNPDGQYLGVLSARQALLDHRLVASGRMVEAIGLENSLRTLSQLGLYRRPQDIPPDGRSLLLAGGRSSLLDLTRAYAILANQGVEAAPSGNGSAWLVDRVALRGAQSGESLQGGSPVAVVSPGLAYLLEDVLSDAGVRKGGWSEGSYAGSSTSTGDSWAFFLTPDFVVGVWAQDPTTAGADLDQQAALPLARGIGRWLEQEQTPETWVVPAGVERLDVCDPSGLLPTRDCPKVVSEVFLSGSEPSQVDNFYQRLAVDVETGRLATLWTPSSLVQEKVFQNPPSQARPWIAAGSIPLAPQAFDTLPSSFPFPSTLHISSPGPFSVVRGVVPILGTAAIQGQSWYELQAGQGFYPSLWVQVQKAASQPQEALLGTWDTRSLQGLVALQLLGVGQDGQVETFAIPVTVDNVPPSLHWIVPSTGQDEQIPHGEVAVIQVQAEDNLGLARVEFYLDGQLADSLTAGPYSVRWPHLGHGRHEVIVRAVDWAGNETKLGPLAVIIP